MKLCRNIYNLPRFCVKNRIPLSQSSRSYYAATQQGLRRVERYNGQIKDEQKRRERIFQKLPEGSALLLSANPTMYMSNDIPYAFRQNSNFYYATGFEEPNSLCVLEKNNKGECNYHLFVMEKDPRKELWDGLRYGLEGAKQFGTDSTLSIDQIQSTLPSILEGKSQVFCDQHTNNFLTTKSIPVPRRRNGDSIIEGTRVFKTDVEIELAKSVTAISNSAFREIMKSGRKYLEQNKLRTVNEHLLSSQLEWECRKLGAQRLAYPPVVAGGTRANTLHYVTNDLPIMEDEMVLVDGGAELHCFSSDVTRTWPVSGKFSDAQKEIYQIVLNVQHECIKASKVGQTISMITQLCSYLIGEELRKIGIIPKSSSSRKIVNEVFPHSIGHYLGMDVHDTPSMSYSTVLAEGMYITIEPGIYLGNSTDIPEKYQGIAVRIEDNILITENGPVVITQDIPKEVEEIEALIRS